VARPRRLDRELSATPFKRFGSIQRLRPDRSGHAPTEHVRHQLFVGQDRRTRANALIKLLTKPGLVYEHNLENEIATLVTINRELPDSRYFPLLWDHGRLPDARVFLIMSLFDEWPLATTIGPEPPDRLVAHLRASLEIAKALAELHRIRVFHVDLNPMNILYRVEERRPVIRIVDFESAYDVARHSSGDRYNPPTTAGFCAPEVMHGRTPDGRADVFSLGTVLYTLIRGYGWTWDAQLWSRIEADPDIDVDLRTILLTAVARDTDRRYQTIEEMSAALAAYLETIWPGRVWV
jgi:hypothetical protein